MHCWQVGEAEVVRITDDDFVLPGDRPVPSWAVPDLATAAGEVGIAFSAIAVADGDRRIVIDPWLANDGPRSEPFHDADRHVQGLLDQLADAGFPADSVDTVVNTHWDGDGWNTRPGGVEPASSWVPTFSNARYLYSTAELARLRSGSHESAPQAMTVLDAAGVLEPVEAGTDISEHVRVLDAPGHRAGHLAVRVECGGELCMVPGHLVLSPLQVVNPSIAADEDAEAATAAGRRLLADLAERHGLLLTTLMGGPGGGFVSRDDTSGGGYRLDPS